MNPANSQHKLALVTRLPEAMQLSEKFYFFLKSSNRLAGYANELIAMQALKQLLSEKLNIGGSEVFSGYQVDPYILADSRQTKEFFEDSPIENGFPVHVLFFESSNSVLTFNSNFISSSSPSLLKLDLIGSGHLKLYNKLSDFIDCSNIISEFEAFLVEQEKVKCIPDAMASITSLSALHPILPATTLHLQKLNSLKYGDFFDLLSESILKFLKSEKIQGKDSNYDLLAEKNKELLHNITKDFSPLLTALSDSFNSRLKSDYSDDELLKIKANPSEWCHLFASSAVLAMLFCSSHKLLRGILEKEKFDLELFHLAPYDAPLLVDRVIQTIYAKSTDSIDYALISLFEHIAIFKTL